MARPKKSVKIVEPVTEEAAPSLNITPLNMQSVVYFPAKYGKKGTIDDPEDWVMEVITSGLMVYMDIGGGAEQAVKIYVFQSKALDDIDKIIGIDRNGTLHMVPAVKEDK